VDIQPVETRTEHAVDAFGNGLISGAVFLLLLIVIPVMIVGPFVVLFRWARERFGRPAAWRITIAAVVVVAGVLGLAGVATHGCFGDEYCHEDYRLNAAIEAQCGKPADLDCAEAVWLARQPD
jgi:hypothetical protein